MTAFILKATIALLVFYAFYRLFLVKERMFGFNRFFLIFALCFSLMVPFLQVPLSFQIGEDLFPEKVPAAFSSEISSENDTFPTQRGLQDEVEASLIAQSDTVVPWNTLLMGIYLSGLFFFLVRFIIQLVQLMRMIRNNLTLKANDCTYVLLKENTLPFTFLHFLFVEKASFQDKTIEKEILFHELTHIRQRHSWDILFLEVLKVVFWFNPVFLLYKNAMQLNHEFLADEAVIGRFRNKAAYQWLLFHKISGKEPALSIRSPFNFSSTRSRLIMMGQSSSKLKTRLLKSLSLFMTGFLMVFLSSGQSYDSATIYAENDYEQILAGALREGNPFELELNKLDLTALRTAYLELNEIEKSESTSFPFFDDLAFEKLLALQQAYPEVKTSILYESPPAKKEIEKDVFERWIKTRNISFTIDDREIEKAEIENYQPADFARFTVRETEAGGLFKKPSYSVSLMTHDYYDDKYVKPGKKIEGIQADYSNGANVEVPYWQQNTETKDGKTSKSFPENYEASIFHQLRVIDPVQLYKEIKKPIKYDPSKSFSIAIFAGEGKPLLFMKLPTI
ncbi:M56 family metallopeptidase [Cyclobacterium plantarum]|uniref:M56 family metallopeptidase n=1 Tax=Cyclobacterium plantarum TaxID=2716263 RepID=A0ABX0H5P9_9BACT|nr:M56 family metallopeptidase [Cyclobacterium plantarum]NHE57171.1 M56 family metallopeptidase [Cyclobacterium plantarum]